MNRKTILFLPSSMSRHFWRPSFFVSSVVDIYASVWGATSRGGRPCRDAHTVYTSRDSCHLMFWLLHRSVSSSALEAAQRLLNSRGIGKNGDNLKPPPPPASTPSQRNRTGSRLEGSTFISMIDHGTRELLVFQRLAPHQIGRLSTAHLGQRLNKVRVLGFGSANLNKSRSTIISSRC